MLQSLTFRSIGYRFLWIGLLGGVIALKCCLVLVYFLDIKYLHLIPGVEILFNEWTHLSVRFLLLSWCLWVSLVTVILPNIGTMLSNTGPSRMDQFLRMYVWFAAPSGMRKEGTSSL